ncbi:hypothetical protein FBU30_000351 [Linnemannia zychae]|nr:hypothetical protein FBU30_000351 [Linnemannia zychae]
MSGTVNARMDGAREAYGEETLEMIRIQCLQPHISKPSVQVQDILIPLQEAFEAGGTERLIDVIEAALGVEASARMKGVDTNSLKRRILGAVRHICTKKPSKTMGEGEMVEVWSYILGAFSEHKLSLRSAEDYELNNSEFKVDSTSEQQVEIQYRKNLRVNQAMMLYLKDQIGMPLEESGILALGVHGIDIMSLSFIKFITMIFLCANGKEAKDRDCGVVFLKSRVFS